MIAIYMELLYKPLLNILVFLYNFLPGNDIAIPIVILTIFIKLILLPLSWQAIKGQKSLQEIQPKINALKEEFKDNKEKIASETMRIYKENKVNPLSSCLPLLIQFPFLIAVYQVFQTGITSNNLGEYLYPFIHNPVHINTNSFNIIDFAVPSIVLAIMAGLAQYVQTAMFIIKKPDPKVQGSKDEEMLASMNKSMQYFMPFMTIIIGMKLPAGLTFYWFITTLLTTLQQKLLFKKWDKTNPAKPTKVIEQKPELAAGKK